MVKIGDLVNILSGYAFDSKKFNDSNGIALVRIRDINRSYSETLYNGDFDKKYIINKNDILIGMDGEFNIAQWNGEKALLNQRVCKISVKDPKVLSERYLLWFLPKKLKEIEAKVSFVTVKHLSVKDIQSIEIDLPSIETQHHIASLLDTADALRKKDQELLKKYDELAQAIFIDMFGDPERNIKKWPFVEVGTAVTIIDYRGKTPERCSDIQIPLLTAKNVKFGYFDYSEEDYITELMYNKIMTRGFPEVNSVLFTTEGATLGNTCRIPSFKKFAIGQRLICLNGVKVTNEYLEYILCSDFFQNQVLKRATGSAVKGIRSAVFKKLLIPIPDFELQVKFSSIIKNIDTQKNLISKSSTHSESLFNNLLSDSFDIKIHDQLLLPTT
jgi:type I restriction enzyme, S subunit